MAFRLPYLETKKFHGLPITPKAQLERLEGRRFCVSHARPDQVKAAHLLGVEVLLDNGAFSAFTKGHTPNWTKFYAWCAKWFAEMEGTLAIIPDEIAAGSQYQDALITEWPFAHRGIPVWHMDEPIGRLLDLVNVWPVVAIGSSGDYWKLLAPDWVARMDATFDAIVATYGSIPELHMLRGLAACRYDYPFRRADSTDIAKNHHRPQNDVVRMADRWDAMDCPTGWQPMKARPPLSERRRYK